MMNLIMKKDNEKDNNEPRIVLLNKDNYKELIPIVAETALFY